MILLVDLLSAVSGTLLELAILRVCYGPVCYGSKACVRTCRLLSENAKLVPEMKDLSGDQSMECCHFGIGVWQQLLDSGLKCHMTHCSTRKGRKRTPVFAVSRY